MIAIVSVTVPFMLRKGQNTTDTNLKNCHLMETRQTLHSPFGFPHAASHGTPRIEPSHLEEHIACSHYLGHQEVKFLHVHLTPNSPYTIGNNETCMLLFLLSGSCRMVSSEQEKVVEMESLQMTFLTAGQQSTIISQTPSECFILRFTEFTFCEMLTLQNLTQLTPEMGTEGSTVPIAPALQAFLQNMRFYIDNRIHCTHLQQIKQDECFILLRICYSKPVLAQLFAPLLSNHDLSLRMKIQQYAAHAHTLGELASRCALTEITLKRKIQKFFGVSPYQWMLKQRNRQILYDLRSGHTLKETCYTYKFSSLGNFTAYCKRQFGFPPSKIIQLTPEEYTKLIEKIRR